VDQGCNGFVLTPNSVEVVSRIGAMAGAGTPTVYIDRDMGGERLSVVMTDNHAAGMQAGREMAKILGGSGKIGLLRMDKNVSSTTAREDGFREAAEQAGLEIVMDEYIGSSVGNARKNAETLLSDADVDGVFTPNESTTVGTALTLKALGKNGRIHHVGFDFTPALKDAILRDDLAGVMV
jgi:ribose transport system substrate-binding protein